MSYILRLFEKDKEVSTSTVVRMFDGADYPEVGQTIDGRWKVVGFISHSDAEHWVHVERLKQ